MRKSLRVSPTLTLPLESVTSTFGLLAVRGAGKSNAGAVMAEEMFAAGLPFVAIDPVGSWPGLRSGANGSPGGGIPIPIFGGRHGDVPLERGAGELVADMISEQRLSCVLDLSKFPSEGDKKAFLLAFARRIYEKNRDPLHLFLEEADDYIPQKPIRDELQLLRAWENIVRRGRGRGLGMTLITQRSAVVAKNVLTQVETLFVLRTTGPQDIAAIEAWVKYHQVGTEMLKTLAGLEDGEAWVWSPHFLRKTERFQFRQRSTFDTGATPKNVHGKDARKVATLADVDLPALQSRMAETIERAKAEDPKLLRSEVAKLKLELAKKPSAPAKEVRVEVPTVDRKAVTQLSKVFQGIFQAAEQFAAAMKAAEKDAAEALFEAQRSSPPPAPAATTHTRPISVSSASPKPKVTNGSNGSARLPKGERAIMIAIAQHPNGATREQLTILTGYKRSTRDAYVQRLTTEGFVEVSGKTIEATDSGRHALGSDYQPLPTGQALLEHWLRRLPEGERKILEAVVDGATTREMIDERAGYKRSTRDAYLQRLGTRRLVIADRGEIRLSEELVR